MRSIVSIILIGLLAGGLLSSPAYAEGLRGRARDAETGLPISDVNVALVDQDRHVVSDHRGEFAFENLPEGTYRLVAGHVAYGPSDTLVVDFPATTSLDIQLEPTPWILNDVVVTGTRSPHLLRNVPVQTEVITREDLQRTGLKSIDAALSSAIGIQINEDLSGQGATIRGVEGERVLILVDGEPAVGRVNGSIDLGQYSLANVEKIEVVKGTGSTLYGSDAMGGVVNIITRRPGGKGPQLSVSGDYGGHNTYSPVAVLDWGNDDLGFTLDARLFGTDGFDLTPETPHTNGQEKTRRLNLNGTMRKRLTEKWSLETSARFMRERKDWFEYQEIDAINKYLYNDVEINYRYDGALSFDYISGRKYSMQTRFFVSYYDHDFDKYNGGWWVDTSHTEDVYYEASYTSNYVIGDGHMATYGLEFSSQDLQSDQVVEESEPDRVWSAYLQYEYEPLKGLTFLPGVRYQYHSSYEGHVNPSLNLMYAVSPQVRLRGMVAQGYRSPSIKQQYFVFDHTAAGYVVYGGRVSLPAELDPGDIEFTDLTQERSINSSISAELSYGNMGLHRVTYFYNDLDDLIEFMLVGFTPEYYRGVYVYQNIDRAITQGIEWESRFRFGKAVELGFSYDYLYTRDLVADRELINRPSHVFKLSVSGIHAATGVRATFWGDYHSSKLWSPQDEANGDDILDTYAPERARLNLSLSKRLAPRWEAFVRCLNMLDDTRYQYGYWPGFEVFAGVNYDWQISK